MPYPHQFITLTPEERARTEKELQRLTLLRRWKRRKPLQALWLSDQKKTFRSIAKYLGVSYRTLRGWVYRYRREGLEGIISWVNRPGPNPPTR